MKNFVDINSLYEKSKNLSNIKDRLEQLEQLNHVVLNLLPDTLRNECHVGAVDSDKNIVVIFAHQQQALFLLNNLSQHILNGLARYNFYFDAVLFRVASLRLDQNNIIKYRTLDVKQKEKLIQLADYIGKAELIHEEKVETFDEHKIKF